MSHALKGYPMGSDITIKQREIRFCPLHPDPEQARTASWAIREVDGVHHTEPLGSHLLQVRYDITYVTLEIIDRALAEMGFHLDASLMSKLRRALFYYTEETERTNLGLSNDITTKIFIDQYQRRRHGCRDPRPRHWRHYL